MSIESYEIKSYIVPVSNIDYVKLRPSTNVLKDGLGKMWKASRPCVICFHKVSKLRHIRLYMLWTNKNELKQDNESNEDVYKKLEEDILCNTKKHELCLNKGYEELLNFSFVQ